MWNPDNDQSALAVQDRETSALDGVRNAYRQQGYDQGYTRASRDIAALLVLAAEEYIRGEALDEADRLLVRGFLRYAERHIEASSSAFTYVEQGLGI
jgi:hypothetical protein